MAVLTLPVISEARASLPGDKAKCPCESRINFTVLSWQSGFPAVRLRWTPTPSVGRFLAKLTACSAAGILAIMVVLVRTPLVCASTIPLLTLSQSPKSSAFIISRRSIFGKFKAAW